MTMPDDFDEWARAAAAGLRRSIALQAPELAALVRSSKLRRTGRLVAVLAVLVTWAGVTEAEGTKSAAITVAEGEKQSAILAAEGQRQAAVLEAQGLAEALHQITDAARTADANTMTLQYFDTLKRLGDSPATKLVLPSELTGIVSKLAGQLSSEGATPTPIGTASPA